MQQGNTPPAEHGAHFRFWAKQAALALTVFTTTLAAHALSVSRMSPQGEVQRVQQIVVAFDSAAIKFGDPKAPEPFTVSCSEASASAGRGRWTSEREWVFDFKQTLGPGVSCKLAPVNGFRSPTGEGIDTKGGMVVSKMAFNTSGPSVVRVAPSEGNVIEEAQHFLLVLTGPATQASLLANVWCEAEGVGERIPVKLVAAKERQATLKNLGYDDDAKAQSDAYPVLACTRSLPPSAKVALVYGPGVKSPSGVASSEKQRFAFTVREPFAATFNCERENAQAACIPLRPMHLTFNAAVPQEMLKAIVLKSGKGKIAAQLSNDNEQEYDGRSSAQVMFPNPLPDLTQFTIELPKGFADDTGRSLRNAANFPLKVATSDAPPLVKFAAAPFGVVERFAEPSGQALLPLTVRKVEGNLSARQLQAGQKDGTHSVQTHSPKTDEEILRWWYLVRKYNESSVKRTEATQAAAAALPPAKKQEDGSRDEYVETRAVSLLHGSKNAGAQAKALTVPAAAAQDPRPFEVVGVPLPPGFHVVEVASARLGASLLPEYMGAQRQMYVRTSALVTNLGVHFKTSPDGAMAWVTSLDKGKPVAGAAVRVNDCDGKQLATGNTDASGIVRLPSVKGNPQRCGDDYRAAYFVTARHTAADGVPDMGFVFSDWQQGIDPWRFNVPVGQGLENEMTAHTVFDRSLFRAGETVSMKHIMRIEGVKGFAPLAAALAKGPDGSIGEGRMVISHQGSGQRYEQAVAWRRTAGGGISAQSQWKLPQEAKLGSYNVQLSLPPGLDIEAARDSQGGMRTFGTGQFTVAEFRLPVMQGQFKATDAKTLIGGKAVPMSLAMNFISGGPAAQLPVLVSASVVESGYYNDDYSEFSFAPPAVNLGTQSGESAASSGQDQRIVLDKQAVTLSSSGMATVTVPVEAAKGKSARPFAVRDLVVEGTYSDPNGEIQTISSRQRLWPASVVVGLRTEGWVSADSAIKFQALALDLKGKPKAGVPIEVRAVARITTTTRKRMVGGFYTYDNSTTTKDLGALCQGKTDERGRLLCETQLKEAGEIELVATATDDAGLKAASGANVYVTRQGELWFGSDDHDRMDVLPEKRTYAPGETARFQVRMPFRYATALVTVERQGIFESRVVELNGKDPTVSVKIEDDWSPNVYVSVLALRGRLREVPWYSLFTWGYKAPREWWRAFWYEGKEYVAPTALVDLSKPAMRLGLAEVRVGTKGHEMRVQVSTDKPKYAVRDTATVTISAKLPNGQAAAGAEVVLAVVDEALLELSPNSTWDLLEALLRPREWGVSTASGYSEIIGRRHYGRKAVPAGGGGGGSNTRELLDTLLLWNPRVVLDANGQATVKVPINDALTSFRVVAAAEAGVNHFGTGKTKFAVTQDLQIISGLPPLVREDDRFVAAITLRNTTEQPMKVQVVPRASLLALATQTVDIAPNAAREVQWDAVAPPQLAFNRFGQVFWQFDAKNLSATTGKPAQDSLKVTQRIEPAVPVTVRQATLVQLDGNMSVEVAPAADALPGRGGLRMSMQASLAQGLPSQRDWFVNYGFSCMEQKASKAMGLRDLDLWRQAMAVLPNHLDADGLAHYFPPREGSQDKGSEVLTTYLLAIGHEGSKLDSGFAIPDESRARMEGALVAFVNGRIERNHWSPRKDLDSRKLMAIEALSRYGKANSKMLESINITPNLWPTHTLVDYLSILQRTSDVPKRDEWLAQGMSILRARFSYQGTKLVFSNEESDYWWWHMVSGDTNTARIMLLTMDDPAWKAELPRIMSGLVARMKLGSWHSTTGNLWGGLAVERFARTFEREPVAGNTRASVGSASASVDWARIGAWVAQNEAAKPSERQPYGWRYEMPEVPSVKDKPGVALPPNTMQLPWPKAGAAVADRTLNVTQQGIGRPWVTLQALAAQPLTEPTRAGYSLAKTITPVEQAVPGKWSRGDVFQVELTIEASADMVWVALTDPIPGGSTILGQGFGRDSEITASGNRGWVSFDEKSFSGYRAYFSYLSKGTRKISYTVRLNNVGKFQMPPSRVEAMYAPEMYGETPNRKIKVEPR